MSIEGPPNNFEKGSESIPTVEEIEKAFEDLLDGEDFEVTRKLEDEEGVYLYEIRAGDAEYSYMRAGQYPEGKALETAIHVVFYDESDIPVGGHSVAIYEDGSF